MRISWLWALLLPVGLMLATTGVARAHVVVSPKEAPANSYQKFAVSVPTEKDISTTGVRVEVPEGFTVTGVQPVPGWRYGFEEDRGVINAITWSGGEIKPREFQEFAFQARTPKDAGEFAWRAFQMYQDGSVVEWTGPPDADEPASVVRVVADGAPRPMSAMLGGESESPAAQDSGGGFTPIAAYTGLGLGALALVVALVLVVVLLTLRRRRSL